MAVIPPRPSAIASAAAHNRRRRSSRYGRKASNFARIVATSCIRPSQQTAHFRSTYSLTAPYALAQRELLKHVHTDEYLASRVSLLRQLQTWKANGRALA
jgi:hypothetical protein